MTHTFPCPACNKTIAADAPAGTQVRCPLCEQVIAVPHPGGPAVSPPTAQKMSPGALPASPYSQHYAPAPSQGMAVGSLVCSILGLLLICFPISIAGLITGGVALSRTKRDPQRYTGRGMAVVGIIISSVTLFLTVVATIVFVPYIGKLFQTFEDLMHREQCKLNMQAIANGLYAYAEGDGGFPEDLNDLVTSGHVLPQNLRCPGDAVGATQSYHYVPGYGYDAGPGQIIVFEDPIIHGGDGGHVIRADGTVEWIDSSKLKGLIESLTLPDGSPYLPAKEVTTNP